MIFPVINPFWAMDNFMALWAKEGVTMNPITEELFVRAHMEYLRTLRVPLNSHERMYNMPYMCFLRDFIAETQGRSAEKVQVEYEQEAGR